MPHLAEGGGREEEEEEHVPPVATDHSLEPWICLNLDNVGPRIGLISISA